MSSRLSRPGFGAFPSSHTWSHRPVAGRKRSGVARETRRQLGRLGSDLGAFEATSAPSLLAAYAFAADFGGLRQTINAGQRVIHTGATGADRTYQRIADHYFSAHGRLCHRLSEVDSWLAVRRCHLPKLYCTRPPGERRDTAWKFAGTLIWSCWCTCLGVWPGGTDTEPLGRRWCGRARRERPRWSPGQSRRGCSPLCITAVETRVGALHRRQRRCCRSLVDADELWRRPASLEPWAMALPRTAFPLWCPPTTRPSLPYCYGVLSRRHGRFGSPGSSYVTSDAGAWVPVVRRDPGDTQPAFTTCRQPTT